MNYCSGILSAVKGISSTLESMLNNKYKVLIYGLPKSGTTILTYRIAEALGAKTQIIFEPKERKAKVEKSKKIVTKCVYKKHNSLDLIPKIYDDYTKKIWIARDPRDIIISDFLYKWYKGHSPNKYYFDKALNKVKQKESNPLSVSFHSLQSIHINSNILLEELINYHSGFYKELCGFINALDKEWLVCRYEDIVDDNYSSINNFLNVKIDNDVEVPSKVERVVRTKSYGHWRDWFTEEDVEIYKPLFKDYIEMMGYDMNDWKLNKNPSLSPDLGSEYMQKIFYS